jgi:hypothetical protein
VIGYVIFWESEYVKKLEEHNDRGPIKVIYGSKYVVMPDLSMVNIGDIIYTVSVLENKLCVMARLPVEKIEASFEYLYRELSYVDSVPIPDGTAIVSQEELGKFAVFSDGMGYLSSRGAHISCVAAIPRTVTRIIDKDKLPYIPHLFHQEPITRGAETALSGEHGSEIYPRTVSEEVLPMLKFGWPLRKQRALSMRNGVPDPCSFRGYVRRMNDFTFEYLDSLF